MEAENYQYVEEEIDLQHYFGILRRHYKIILSVVVVAGSLAAIYAFKLPNVYQAAAQILVQKDVETSAYAEFKVDAIGATSDQLYFNTQLEILRSEDLLSRAVREGNLADALLEMRNIAVSKGMPEDSKIRAAVAGVHGGLSVSRIKDTRIFTVAYSSGNPILCKEVPNAVARTFVKQYLEQRLYVPQELLQFFPEDAAKIETETPYRQLERITRADAAKTLPSVVNDPLIRQLQAKAAEAEGILQRLRETYRGKHPKVVEAKATLKFIKDRITVETENIVRNLKTTLTSQLQVSRVRILREAEVPGGPAGPNRMRIILAGLVGAFIVAATLLIFKDFLDDTIKAQEDIEKFIQLPFLGMVPAFREKIRDVHQKAFLVHYNPLSDVSEAFRFVKVAINFSGAPGTLKCLSITSSIPAEGKSLVGTNLVASFLRDGERVLLVDADLRHPTLHLLTNTDNLKGLSNYLSSTIPFEEVVQKTAIPQLDVIVSGPLSPNPTELFASYRMENFIREAKSLYDRILVDTPPVIGLADSLVISTKCDGVILLIQARHISRKLVKKAKQRLLETGAKILGVVINRVDLEKEDPAYRYFAQGYYTYRRGKREGGEGEAAHSSSG